MLSLSFSGKWRRRGDHEEAPLSRQLLYGQPACLARRFAAQGRLVEWMPARRSAVPRRGFPPRQALLRYTREFACFHPHQVPHRQTIFLFWIALEKLMVFGNGQGGTLHLPIQSHSIRRSALLLHRLRCARSLLNVCRDGCRAQDGLVEPSAYPTAQQVVGQKQGPAQHLHSQTDGFARGRVPDRHEPWLLQGHPKGGRRVWKREGYSFLF